MSFNWETEDESSEWQEKEMSIKTDRNSRPNRRRRRLIISSVLTAALAGVLYFGIDRFIQSQEDELKVEIEAAYDLLEEAALARDRELLTFLLSATDETWNENQLTLLRKGKLIDRSLPHYIRLDETEDPQLEISLSADFSEAIVTRTYTYQHIQSQEQMHLSQTAIFRQGIDRWLFTIPLDRFWGETKQIEGDQITLVYRDVDAPFANDLHNYLEREVSKYCLATQACPGREILTVSLEHYPVWVDHLSAPNLSLSSRQINHQLEDPSILALPSITAFGQPLDEASEEQLYAYYASHVVSRISYEIVANQIRRPRLIDWAIVATQLQNLDLPYYINPGELGFNQSEAPASYTWLWEYQSNWTVTGSPIGNREEAAVWEAQHHSLTLIQFLQFMRGNGIIWDSRFQRTTGNSVTLEDWLGTITGQSMTQLETTYATFLGSEESVATQ